MVVFELSDCSAVELLQFLNAEKKLLVQNASKSVHYFYLIKFKYWQSVWIVDRRHYRTSVVYVGPIKYSIDSDSNGTIKLVMHTNRNITAIVIDHNTQLCNH